MPAAHSAPLFFTTDRLWRVVATLVAFALLNARAGGAELAPAPDASPELDSLLDAGRQLWDEYASPDLKENYEFPTPESVETFLAALEQALADGSWEELAGYTEQARLALPIVRQFQGGDEIADWLEPRLDFLTAADAFQSRPPDDVNRAPSPLTRPYWDDVAVGREPPARARALVPRLQAIFADEGIPPAWVWMAEVESSMNPRARSPAGARGLFQFMPATAQRFGMRTAWPDERIDPEKSARAAAQYLRFLHGRFGSWPLAIAAYNAGEGRVGRALSDSGTATYPEVARHLPAETRLYVPKVMATVAARESVTDPTALPPPRF